MNSTRAIHYVLLFVASCGMSSPGFAATPGSSQSDLEREATVDRTRAEQLALMDAHEGTVKRARLDRDNGKLVWTFDISQYHGRSGIVEVQVDATTGAIISSNVKTAQAAAPTSK